MVSLLHLQMMFTAKKLACPISASEVEGQLGQVSVPQFPFLQNGKTSSCRFEGPGTDWVAPPMPLRC